MQKNFVSNETFPAYYTLKSIMVGDVVCDEVSYDRLELNVKQVAHKHMQSKKQYDYVIIVIFA